MFGGTYWPPEPRWGRPSFRQVLESVDAAWRDPPPGDGAERRPDADRASRRAFGAEPRPRISRPTISTRVGDGLLAAGRSGPWRHRRRAEIPQRADLPLLLERDVPPPRSKRSARPCGRLLEAMSAGGIYDHLGGGYARYSTDAEWLVPHFEKMLYDNAQILELLALVQAAMARPAHSPNGRARRSAGSCARCGSATPSPPRSTPTRRARKARSTSGREEEIDARAGRRRGALQGRLRRDARAAIGKAGRCSAASPRSARPRRRPTSPPRARSFSRVREGAPEARPRRQGAGRLERP